MLERENVVKLFRSKFVLLEMRFQRSAQRLKILTYIFRDIFEHLSLVNNKESDFDASKATFPVPGINMFINSQGLVINWDASIKQTGTWSLEEPNSPSGVYVVFSGTVLAELWKQTRKKKELWKQKTPSLKLKSIERGVRKVLLSMVSKNKFYI
ncbi:hypothetical protein MKW92_024046 [Papaver armeniacum]|nr:hypothetical protein MKW92_024046 [Papaver armeniacum]